MGWDITGSLYRVASQHGGGRGVYGLGKIPEGRRLDEDDARGLATDLVIVAIDAFRTKTLMNKKRTWQPTGGASLKTFFIGRCLMELPDVYAEWDRREHRALNDPCAAEMIDDGCHCSDPADQATASRDIDDVFDGDPKTRLMFQLQDAGYSLEEIADMLGSAGISASEASVRSRMSRLRTAARQRRTDG